MGDEKMMKLGETRFVKYDCGAIILEGGSRAEILASSFLRGDGPPVRRHHFHVIAGGFTGELFEPLA